VEDLQVSVCSGYDSCDSGWQFFWFLHFDPPDFEKYVKPRVNLSVGTTMSDCTKSTQVFSVMT